MTTCFKHVIISWTEYSFLSKQSVMSVPKRAWILYLNRISELVWYNESYEVGAPSDSSSEVEGGFKEEPGVSHLQPDRPASRCHASSSSLSSNACDEEEIFQSGLGQQVQTPPTSQWTRPSVPHRSVVHAFREGPRGRGRGAPRQWSVTYNMTDPVQLAFSCWIVQKLSHCWWRRPRDTTMATLTKLTTDLRRSLTWLNKILFFLVITIQLCPRDKLAEYWATTKQFHTRFYSSAMQRGGYRHILRFLQFTDDNNELDMTDENSDGLWKTLNLFEILNKTFSKFYSPSEQLAVDEVIFFFSKEGSFPTT